MQYATFNVLNAEGTFNGQDAMYYCIELANFFQRLYEIGKIDKTANVQRK